MQHENEEKNYFGLKPLLSGRKKGFALTIPVVLLILGGLYFAFNAGLFSSVGTGGTGGSITPPATLACSGQSFAGQDQALLVTGFHLGEDSNVTVVTLTGNIDGAGYLSNSATYQAASRTVKHGAGYAFAVRNTSGYFGGIYKGNIECDTTDSLQFPIASRGGITFEPLNGSGDISTGTNGTCVANFASAGSSVTFRLKMSANQTYSMFTNPNRVGGPAFVVQVELPAAVADAIASPTAATPSTLAYASAYSGYGVAGLWSCKPRTNIQSAIVTSGRTRYAWECGGNVGLNAKDFNRDSAGNVIMDARGVPKTGGADGYGPQLPSIITLEATLQANAGWNPTALNADGNGTLNWTVWPMDVFENTITKELGIDFESNVGTRVAAVATAATAGTAIC